MSPGGLRLPGLLVLVALAGCRTGQNYVDPAGPRYAAAVPVAAVPSSTGPDSLRVVSFNVEHALRVDGAIALLTSSEGLRDADVVLLQEMDAEGTRRIAEALAMGYVYYPATFHLGTERDFGNAVLSRWPIASDEKIFLPHVAPFGRIRRIATAVTLMVSGAPVRVYSVHLGTVVNVGPGAQRAQFRAVLADAARHERVVIGGDMNTAGVGGIARDQGYAWPTEEGPRTLRWGRWDHIFFRGLGLPQRDGAGTVLEIGDVSDHRPVWAVGILEAAGQVLSSLPAAAAPWSPWARYRRRPGPAPAWCPSATRARPRPSTPAAPRP